MLGRRGYTTGTGRLGLISLVSLLRYQNLSRLHYTHRVLTEEQLHCTAGDYLDHMSCIYPDGLAGCWNDDDIITITIILILFISPCYMKWQALVDPFILGHTVYWGLGPRHISMRKQIGASRSWLTSHVRLQA
jgi:hypothetical protein